MNTHDILGRYASSSSCSIMLHFSCVGSGYWSSGHIVLLALQELRKDGFDLAVVRYRELKPILDEVI